MVSKKRLEPPKARKKNKKIKVHGLVVNDDYSWLRDDNWQEVLRNPSILKPNIKKFLDNENKWTDKNLKHLKKSKNIIFEEIKSRINENDRSLPVKDGKYLYLTETKKGLQYSILKRKLSNNSKSRYRTIIDWNILSKKYKYFKPGGVSYSHDQKIFNYSYDSET